MRMRRKQRQISHFLDGIGISLARLVPIARCRGLFGQINLFRHPELGKVFVLNDEIQHVEAWAPLYHEPLVHLPTSFVPHVKDVLILGGGTLYAASEVLKYKTLKRVVLVDHDPEVTWTVVQHYAHAKACVNDTRFALLPRDAYSGLSGFHNEFDLIINDGADLLNVQLRRRHRGSVPNLFSLMSNALKPKGVCADVIWRHLFERRRVLRTLSHLPIKCRLALSLVFLPEYHGVLHMLSMWGKRSSLVSQLAAQPNNKEQTSWIRTPTLSPCMYYDPRFLPLS
jgi:spermidine synthase